MFTVLWKLSNEYEELYSAKTVEKTENAIKLYDSEKPNMETTYLFREIRTGTVYVMNAMGKTVATYHLPSELPLAQEILPK